MKRITALGLFISAMLLAPGHVPAQQAGAPNMSFFVTSTNPGQGADLGGLAGADAHCERLAQAAGLSGRTWRAYLSTQGAGAVNARDRIGRGPWRNARGEVVANDVQQLHAQNNLTLQTALNERGEPVNGRRQQPNNHDILTGSQPDGTAFSGAEDRTCRNWTSGGEGSAFVGHHDREGLRDDEASRSWNSSHASRGCSLEALRTTGGSGLFYCFAAE
ncbi:hypothetical protein [Sabulicella glaciei]|uniref:Lectin n=1 Tax=Sabulicella glaciei TaxID=2984948 RepID=A0ABT3P1Z0_9PROT|nr:hypothetical protein [Roseococcus sp. MDT2-1-1]MCW8088435.1 hypothetical protein [Roseococcus sp. MDT2-1-1]